MTVERWMASRALAVLGGMAGVVLLLIAGIDAIERSRMLGAEGSVVDLVVLVAWRLPALGRELVPVWAAVSAALLVGWWVRTGTWEALQAAGVSERRALAVLVGVIGVVGGTSTGILEVLVPLSATRAAAIEGRMTDQDLRLAGDWVRLGETAFRVGAAEEDALVDVTVIRVREGHLERLDAARVTWDGEAWVGLISEQGEGARVEKMGSLPLPEPAQAEVLVRPRATAEAGLMVLQKLPVPGARAWLHRRLAGLGAPVVVALLAMMLARRRRPGLAASVALGAVGAGVLHLGIAVLAEALGPAGVWTGWGLAGVLAAYLTASIR